VLGQGLRCVVKECDVWLRSVVFGQGSGLSLRAGSQEFSPATTSLGPGYFDTKRNIAKRKMNQTTKL